ncbi:MAG: AAA family ATPase [Desulfomicrobium apsheronum]|jgi:predicted kinase|nr:AAA family ATPase [Desulfomicrobium apsheronum]
MNRILYILRGLPGSGKSTLAQKLVREEFLRETDMFFMINGKYNFDHTKIKNAHLWCQSEIEKLMIQGYECAVSNTFIKKWEYQPYLKMAKKYNYKTQIIECHGQWENTHGVTFEKLQIMKNNWEPHIRNR